MQCKELLITWRQRAGDGAVRATEEEQDSNSVCTRGRSRARGENIRSSALCLDPTKQ